MYQEFEKLLAHHRFVSAAIGKERLPEGVHNAAFREEVFGLYAKRFPRRKLLWYRIQTDLPEYAAIEEKHQANAIAYLSALREQQKALLMALQGEAEALPVPRAEGWLELQVVSGGSYHTQGFGANKYARDAAEGVADKARNHGLEAEVQVIGGSTSGGRSSYGYEDYGVYAKTTEFGKVVLGYKTELPLREQVKRCLQRGANPFTYMPFLPQDYLEKVGLDAWGNEVRPALEEEDSSA